MKTLLQLSRAAIICIFLMGIQLQSSAQSASEEGNDFNFPYVKMDRNSDLIYLEARSFKAEKINNFTGKVKLLANEVVQNGIVRILQFSILPNQSLKEEMASRGLFLLDYIPNRAFIAHLNTNTKYQDLIKWNVQAMAVMTPDLKMDKFITTSQYPEYVIEGTKRRLVVRTFENIDFSISLSKVSAISNVEIIQSMENLHAIEILIDENKVHLLAENKYVKYIEIGQDEGKAENFTARTLHRSNTINTSYLGGKKYDGSGVSVMMQDDGGIGPHIDFKGRVDQSLASITGSNGDHGDHVAGTFMGSGNLDPLGAGMAPGVFGHIAGNLNSNYNFVPGLFTNDSVVITTKSYSNGCNAGYTTLTEQLDNQVVTYDPLVHVFSAGNSNGSNCGYGAGSQWGNITGGHKVGKNVITVANLNFTDNISSSSSRGPAADGRIKPDISAKGSSVYSTIENYDYGLKSGTSMSCPGVTGILAQLYHAYRDHNGGANPNSALMKAIALNTAEDLGNPGPDYIFGWGRINAKEAYKVIENKNYLDSVISNGDSVSHILNIPNNVSRVKIMLYWKDPAASVSSVFDLVNDLDLKVTDPGASLHLPLVLDPTPNSTSLNFPATPGIDNLNNMEQVVIDQPSTGSYEIKINGTMVPQGPQEYYIVYRYEFDEIDLTYPIGGEPISPGENQVIRWDAFGNSLPFSLDYSLDSGQSWTNITSNVSATLRYFSWNVPNNISTNKGLVRISRGTQTDVSESTFSILGVPSNLDVFSSCTDSAALSWQAVANADGYEVRKLGNQYMDSVEFTTSTSTYINNIDFNDPNVWLTVQAVFLNSSNQITGMGRRAVAIRKASGIYNCPTVLPTADFSANKTAVCVDGTVLFNNETVNGSGNYTWTITPSSHTFVNGTNQNSENPEVQFHSNSDYTVKLDAANLAGVSTEEKVDYINTFAANTNLNESFEFALFPPLSWTIEPSAGSITWVSSSVNVGPDGSATKAAYFNRFGDVSIGEEDALVTRAIDISDYTNPMLVFDVAYAAQSSLPPAVSGGLRIDYSNDCGSNFQTSAYFKPSNDLMTTGFQASLWEPNSSTEWRSDSLDLSAMASKGVVLKFINISGINSNSLFLDNIRVIDFVTGLNEESKISLNVYPNPTNGSFTINASNLKGEKFEISIIDSKGKELIKRSKNSLNSSFNITFDMRNLSSGLYTIKVIGENSMTIKKLSYIKN
ncbi:S8 family serine peptidase [Hyphobacterium sp. CCMP332]|nr:S8 family serine peptidase [Hyphobacterium sp. CCMP332]